MPILSESEWTKSNEKFLKQFRVEEVVVDDQNFANVMTTDRILVPKGIFEKIEKKLVYFGGDTYTVFDERKYLSYPPCGNPDNNSPPPKFQMMAFFYLKIQNSSKITIRYYEKPFKRRGYSKDEMNTFVDEKVAESRAAGPDADSIIPDEISWNFGGYVGFFLDNEEWNVIDIRDRRIGQRSLSFHVQNAVALEDDDSDIVVGNYQEHRNWSFYRAENIKLISDDTGRYVFVENHHNEIHVKNRRRDQDSTGIDKYKFDLAFEATVQDEAGEGDVADKKRLLMIIDPGGRNTGP